MQKVNFEYYFADKSSYKWRVTAKTGLEWLCPVIWDRGAEVRARVQLDRDRLLIEDNGKRLVVLENSARMQERLCERTLYRIAEVGVAVNKTMKATKVLAERGRVRSHGHLTWVLVNLLILKSEK